MFIFLIQLELCSIGFITIKLVEYIRVLVDYMLTIAIEMNRKMFTSNIENILIYFLLFCAFAESIFFTKKRKKRFVFTNEPLICRKISALISQLTRQPLSHTWADPLSYSIQITFTMIMWNILLSIWGQAMFFS